MPTSLEVGAGIAVIDTRMADTAGLTSSYLVRASAPAIIETGPATSADPVIASLARLGVGANDLAHVVVTHIHLDHAGAAGHLAEHFPRSTIWVHEIGAPHLAEPSRLMASAARVYGEERLQRLFGTMRPVPADRIRTLGEADMIDLGNRSLTALYTPGHARHHVALQDRSSGAVFTGDAVGIHLPGIALLRPATPPPEFDMELAIRSIERIRRHARWTLMFSHFGPVGSVDETCTVAIETIRRWGELVHAIMATTEDLTAVSAALEAATRAEHVGLSDGERRHLEAVSSYETNSAGLLRYWSTPAAPS